MAIPAESFVFSAEARVDNRVELARELNLSAADSSRLNDEELVRLAYCRWGEECPVRIYGDWAFAAWHPRERYFFLARDHFGNTAVYYHADERVFAFASSIGPLLTLDLSPVLLDELYLAQVVTSWPGYHGERTIHFPLRRLPPAHSLRITMEQREVRCYWRMEEIEPLILPKREDYVEPFLAVFDEAVRGRLRPSPGTDGQGVAAMLSGGLDSSSVAVTAAMFLRDQGRRLSVFTSVPETDPSGYIGKRFGDEFPFAASVARQAGNMDHYPVPATRVSPIGAIRRMLNIFQEPVHAAGNLFWILALEEQVKQNGASILLNGQLGNAGISWTGDPFSCFLRIQLASLGWRRWSKEQLKRATPVGWLTRWHRLRRDSRPGLRGSAIHPEFARRLRLVERRLEDPEERFTSSPFENRIRFLQPGRSLIGALSAAKKAANGIEYRDPTGDPRVLSFCLSIPDWVFIDPGTGLDRWLIRAAMKGRLPDDVRLNRNRGRQAGDLVPRLRACAVEVDEALDDIAQGPAAEYLDASHMSQVWHKMQASDTPQAFRDAVCVLTRGIMAGLFVNQFFATRAASGRLSPP